MPRRVLLFTCNKYPIIVMRGHITGHEPELEFVIYMEVENDGELYVTESVTTFNNPKFLTLIVALVSLQNFYKLPRLLIFPEAFPNILALEATINNTQN